ncbi:MAG: DNA alkylation repair protein, partial [Bacteroidota bacterium]
KMLKQLREWTNDPNPHVRRLVSEGTRTRLPWAARLPDFQREPQPVFDLLELLKEDPVLYVRRSVANNLNDIAKDHPEKVVDLLTAWSSIDNEGTQWIIRHASRTLVKAGNTRALALLGYPPNPRVAITDFDVSPKVVALGETAVFKFTIKNDASGPTNLMIDYIVHFMKKNGKTAPKVFKLAKREFFSGEEATFEKKQSFRPLSTRKYYAGTHAIELQINGTVIGRTEFDVTE